jgi:iron complex transport system ATP-binding protein
MVKDVSIKISSATFGYKKTKTENSILKNINVDFYAGDFIGIAGINGSGKSTLLKTLCSLQPLLSGEILINSTSIEQISTLEISKKIATVFTEKISGFNLTVFDVVAAGQMPYTNIFHQLNERNLEVINSAISQCGLSLFKNKPLNELSDGLFQKTMIAKCIAQQASIMLLDEPSAFLDYASKHELFILLKKLAEEQQKCILLSSHDLDLLLKYCSKILIVANGNVELINTNETLENGSFIQLSGGFLARR